MSKNIVAIDKPPHCTSNAVIQQLKQTLKLKKIGHGGTLDPLATGVLIIGINNGTKYLSHHLVDTKEYLAEFTFGYETDTWDSEGTIVNEKASYPSVEDLEKVLIDLKNNEYWQTPPIYSAVKINGKPAYKYARENQTVTIAPKLVKLNDYEIISYDKKVLKIRIDVSKGFYVRSFGKDLADKLNTYATMTALRRTRSGDYKIEDALTIEEFINEYQKQQIDK